MKGTYILEINILEEQSISIGSLGLIPFKKGNYYYVGSAMGNSGSATLINRVKRHATLPEEKTLRWHIDYLLENENSFLTKIYMIPCSQKLECELAQELLSISDGFIKNFGSSDCKCVSHLLFFDKNHKFSG
jgi:sugar fermentation stimulation protein A